MRDVNNGWLIRYLHSNTASAFFFLVYLHVGRGLYYGSYKAPRTLVWTIGTVILILMMAISKWPNWMFIFFDKITSAPLGKSRVKAMHRIGPHDKEVLSVLICGMLGDWWSDKIPGQISPSIRFNIEQGVVNVAYIHHLTTYFFERGYTSYILPKVVKKTMKGSEPWFNYRLTLYTFSSFVWIHDSFYKQINGMNIKVLPSWIEEYITPIGLAHWIMQDGSRQMGQGISIATHNFTYDECLILCGILHRKFNLKCTVIKSGHIGQWRISIWKQSMTHLSNLIGPFIIDEMKYKLAGYL